MKVKEAKLSDLKAVEGKRDLLGGPSFSLSALEMFMMAPDFTVQVAGDASVVLYHEGKGGKSRMLLLVGGAPPELLRAAEEIARKAGSIKITLEAAPDSAVIPALKAAGYVHKGEVANYYGKDRPAQYMEKIL
jgi:hypothetical protein